MWLVRWWALLRPWVSDALVVLGAALVAVTPVALYRRGHALAAPSWSRTQWLFVVVLAAAGCLALAVRRRWPMGVLAWACALTVAGAPVAESSKFTSVTLVVALYTVAAHRDWRFWLAGGVVAEAAKGGTELAHGGPLALLGGLVYVVAPIAVGVAVANRRGYVAAIRERAVRAEATKEAEARRRVAEERIRIARELHDVLGHSMAVIGVQSGLASHLIHRDPHRAQQALVHINDASHAALAELRTTIALLRDPDECIAPNRPLPDLGQLEELVAQVRAAGLSVETHLSGDLTRLPAEVGLVGYRVLQEALTNVLKHARARSVELTAEADGRRLRLDVCDDGVGATAAGCADGHGRVGMRERVRALGGVLHDGPAERGYRVRAVIPLAQRA